MNYRNVGKSVGNFCSNVKFFELTLIILSGLYGDNDQS